MDFGSVIEDGTTSVKVWFHSPSAANDNAIEPANSGFLFIDEIAQNSNSVRIMYSRIW